MEAAARLREAVPVDDTVARFGGDEFTIVCESADEYEAHQVAKRVLRALSKPFEHENREFRLTASIGIRLSNSPNVPADLLLHDADVALYAAKEQGRGCFEIYDSAVGSRRADQLATEQAIRSAVHDGELRLYYQPTINLATGQVLAVEALVRWQDPERGLLPPGAFIPLAEESDLIVHIGEWVLREACAQLASWRAAGAVNDQFRVAVNVSGRQLSRPELGQTVTAALSEAGLDPSALCLEITESALFHDTGMALSNIQAIKQLGVVVALDDFGVGFSSLSRIRELPPIDLIKIDRSFVAGFEHNSSDRAVISAILSLASQLDAQVVAEGIESEAQLRALKELGCDLGQGFLLARPQPPEQLVGLLDRTLIPAKAVPALSLALPDA